MLKFRTTLAQSLCAFMFASLINSPALAAGKKTTGGNAKSCSEEINKEAGQDAKAAAAAEQVKPADIRMTLQDIASTDPEVNPISKHPGLIIPSAQKYARLFFMKPPKVALDPVFKVNRIEIYPAFTGEIGDPNKMIVGQYQALTELANFIKSRARGNKGGKLLLAIGPAGTGKTETFVILDAVNKALSTSNPEFFEYTFQWLNLHEVADLQAYQRPPSVEGRVTRRDPDMQRSPFTLLREDIQDAVLDAVEPEVQNLLGEQMPVNVWRQIAPKDAEILEAILRHEIPEYDDNSIAFEDIPAEQYMEAVSKYVRILPRKNAKGSGSDILRAMGDNPNLDLVFASQNPRMSTFYPQGPLGWDFTGTALRTDGRALIVDEAYRNIPEFLDILLELAQNSIAQAGGGPAVEMDTITMFASNDESLEKASEDGSMKASIDRAIKVPMRLNLHPHEISKTALLMIGADNFKMRRLGDKEAQIEPLDLNRAYPLPDEHGNIVGIEKRFALYYQPRGQRQPILISPQTMEMLGLFASITRIKVDPKILSSYPTEFEVLTPRHEYFNNPIQRLKMMLGQATLETATRRDLSNFSKIAKEGESGISSRDIQELFQSALDSALSRGHGVLTPQILDEVFNEKMRNNSFEISGPKLFVSWRMLTGLVKSEFILKALAKDIREIIGGQGERARRLYKIVEMELVQLSEDESATEIIMDNGGQSVAINKERLGQIKKIYFEENKRHFAPGMLMKHYKTASESEPHPGLLSAIETWLTRNETDIQDTVREIVNHYEGTATSPETEKKVSEFEARLHLYGYDENSFKAAMELYGTLHLQQQKRQQN
jgi:predicted Ser/Thr protein kinase